MGCRIMTALATLTVLGACGAMPDRSCMRRE